MKTVIVYDAPEETTFYLMEGDFSHLEGVIGNTGEYDEVLEEEVMCLDFGDSISTKEVKEYILSGADLVHIGVI